jgi:hypothetical protein
MNEGVIVWRVAWRTPFTLLCFFWDWRFDRAAYTSNRRPMEKSTQATVSHRYRTTRIRFHNRRSTTVRSHQSE